MKVEVNVKQSVCINICQEEMALEQSTSPCALDHMLSNYVMI